jgi:hypothetical protein
MTIASPTLLSFLLRQSRTEQIPFARLLNTSQPRISRVTQGTAELSEDEWQAGSTALALGRRDKARQPVWIVTRFHASGEIDPPPLASDHTLAVFSHYRYARAVVGYLRDLGGVSSAYAVPVWPSYVAEQLEQRGPESSERRFTATEDAAGTTLIDWLPKLVRGFASEQRQHGVAGYGWN